MGDLMLYPDDLREYIIIKCARLYFSLWPTNDILTKLIRLFTTHVKAMEITLIDIDVVLDSLTSCTRTVNTLYSYTFTALFPWAYCIR